MIQGYATPEGTARFASRNAAAASAGFYRKAQGLTLSTLGLGTYLGELSDETDRNYIAAATAAVGGGVNVLDAAINYRHQRSERCLGEACRLLDAEGVERSEYVVCTKGGFLTPGAIPAAGLAAGDLVQGVHSLSVAFLEDQLERSRANLGLETIDVYYLHNPETQLAAVAWGQLEERLASAFAMLERKVAEGKIRYYGTATWNGYRQKRGERSGFSLVAVEAIARQVGGANHHFRFVQLPVNLAMMEAYTLPREPFGQDVVSVLEGAQRLGVTVIASASLLQARLAENLPPALASLIPGAQSDAQRAIQCTRSTPGVAVALVGMSSPAHVVENLGVSTFPPLREAEFRRLFFASPA